MIKIYCLKGKYAGLALWPFMFLKKGASNAIITHERIHFRQQVELLILPFYAIYILNYIFNCLRYAGHERAYRNIIFEREAYANQGNTNYLKERRLYSFL